MPKLRKHLRSLRPYPIPVKPEMVEDTLLRLDANENFSELNPEVIQAAERACSESQGYPDDFAQPLRSQIALVHRIDSECIACARGAMELISLLVNLYLEPGTNAVVSEFGYLYFRTAIAYSGAETLIAPEKNLTVDIESVLHAINPETRMVFLANPGNPSGTIISNEETERLRTKMPDDVLLVLDEAYFEYIDPTRLNPNFQLVESSNTVVLRTFSKIYGLAGYRVGWAYLPKLVAHDIRIIQQPNAVSHVSQMAAKVAMSQQAAAIALREQNQRIRNTFANKLEDLELSVMPSNTNFVLVKFDCADTTAFLEQSLRKNGILVRPMNAYQLPDYLRITIGSESDMARVAAEIERLLDQ